jgi:hypothetical protein
LSVALRRPESKCRAYHSALRGRRAGSHSLSVVARVTTKLSAIPQTTPPRVTFSLSGFDRRKRIGTNESLLNQAPARPTALSPTAHAPDDVFARGGPDRQDLLQPVVSSVVHCQWHPGSDSGALDDGTLRYRLLFPCEPLLVSLYTRPKNRSVKINSINFRFLDSKCTLWRLYLCSSFCYPLSSYRAPWPLPLLSFCS